MLISARKKPCFYSDLEEINVMDIVGDLCKGTFFYVFISLWSEIDLRVGIGLGKHAGSFISSVAAPLATT